MKRPESVLVIIATDEGEVLLLERLSPPGFWQSVTGSLEWQERPHDAAVREVYEETGLDVSDRLIDCEYVNQFPIIEPWSQQYAPEHTENREYVFVAHFENRPDIRLNSNEHSQYLWLTIDQAIAKASSCTNQQAISDFARR